MSRCSARQMTLIAAVCVAVTLFATPVRAQMLVYDPSNYAQNVLQAARALQQINNQITSLQNQSQMLLATMTEPSYPAAARSKAAMSGL